MNPDEDTGELETAIAVEDDQSEPDDQEAQEASTEDQTDAPDDDQIEPEEASEPLYDVTIDGKEVKLSKSDLEKGFMLNRDYTQKRQADAAQRRDWDAKVQQDTEVFKGWLEFYQANQPPTPDWDAMSPAQWVDEQRKWSKEAGKRTQAQQMHQQIQQQQESVRQEQFVSELYEAFPAWQNKNVMMQEIGEIYVAAKDYGYSQDDVNLILDPRQFQVLKDAADWRKLQAKKSEVQTRVSEVAKKPPLRTVAAPRPGKDLLAELAKNPTIANAMKLDF